MCIFKIIHCKETNVCGSPLFLGLRKLHVKKHMHVYESGKFDSSPEKRQGKVREFRYVKIVDTLYDIRQPVFEVSDNVLYKPACVQS